MNRLLWTTFLACFISPTVQVTCYNSKGYPWGFVQERPVEAWMPCNLTAEVTNCCSPRDYCMSNGLCMNAVVDNMISQQGCTDKDWDSPCFNYCEDTESDPAGLHTLWRCKGQNYCCASNTTTSCCEDPDVKTFHLNVGFQLHFPPKSTTASPASTAASASATSSSATASAVSQDTTPTTPISNQNIESPENDTRVLAIGLGVGIPLGLAIIASLIFVGMQLLKRNRQANTQPAFPPALHTEHYQPQVAYKPPTESGFVASTIPSYHSGPAELSSNRDRAELR